jgi:hypothetical protein
MRLPTALCAGVLLALLSSAQCGEGLAAGYDARAIVEGCARFSTRIRTCSGSFQVDVDPGTAEAPGPAHTGLRGRWVMNGTEMMERSVVSYPPLSPEEQAASRAQEKEWDQAASGGKGRPPDFPGLRPHGEYVTAVFFDGQDCYIKDRPEPEPGQPGGRWLSGDDAGRVARQSCLSYRWLGMTSLAGHHLSFCPPPRPPLPTMEAEPEIVARERISGVDCLKIVGRKPLWGIYHVTWWVAPEHDYAIVRCDQVSYPAPGGPVKAGEHLLWRWRVRTLRSFGGGIVLPVEAEWVTARVTSEGSVRVLRRERFRAADVAVNEPVSLDLFEVPEKTLSVGSCAYDALASFCKLMGAPLDPEEAAFLAGVYLERDDASFLDTAQDLQAALGLPIAGYAATLDTVAGLQRPVIAHLTGLEGEGHFAVVESLDEHFARLVDAGETMVVELDWLREAFSGAILAIDTEALPATLASAPSLHCRQSICDSSSASVVHSTSTQYAFQVSNTGGEPLVLSGFTIWPEAAPISVHLPGPIPPAGSAEVVVALAGAARDSLAVITTNDPFRPRLYLGSGHRILN